MCKLSYYWIYNHQHCCILLILKKCHHMLRTLKKRQPQSPPILENTPPFHRIPISLNLSPNQFQIVQNIQYTRTLHSPGKNIQTTTDPNWKIFQDDEENWEEGQFADVDLTDHHNTTAESDRICQEYSTHFVKVTDQGYSSPNNIMPGLEYYIPEPKYYNSNT